MNTKTKKNLSPASQEFWVCGSNFSPLAWYLYFKFFYQSPDWTGKLLLSVYSTPYNNLTGIYNSLTIINICLPNTVTTFFFSERVKNNEKQNKQLDLTCKSFKKNNNNNKIQAKQSNIVISLFL